jgi:hypothetical protein
LDEMQTLRFNFADMPNLNCIKDSQSTYESWDLNKTFLFCNWYLQDVKTFPNLTHVDRNGIMWILSLKRFRFVYNWVAILIFFVGFISHSTKVITSICVSSQLPHFSKLPFCCSILRLYPGL